MAYVKREGEKKSRRATTEFTCAEKVRGLGTQWIGTEGALDAAKKDWMERVRYDYGKSFLDMNNAKDFVSRCGRVSIGEDVGQVMYRCEIVRAGLQGYDERHQGGDEIAAQRSNSSSALWPVGWRGGWCPGKTPRPPSVRFRSGGGGGGGGGSQLTRRKALAAPPPGIADAAMI